MDHPPPKRVRFNRLDVAEVVLALESFYEKVHVSMCRK
jgi:hypothetical protein